MKIKNSLAKLFPGVANEWDYEKNGELTPYDVAARSQKKFWWICSKMKHTFQASISNRTSPKKPTNCPYCSRRKVNKENCLATTHPELSKEWHPTLNNILTPFDIVSGREKKVWWICEKGHDYEASPMDRSGKNKTGCPFCNHKKVCKDTCLATTHPHLIKEWHPTKNGSMTPSDVFPGMNKKVWWICTKKHEYQASPAKRTCLNPRKCPYCANKRVCEDNCLATNHPKVAKEWHPTKNGNLTPNDVLPGSPKKIWWVCSKGHAYNSSLSNRAKINPTGCPYCANKKVCDDNCLATTHPKIAKEWHLHKNGKLTPYDVLAGLHQKVWWLCHNQHEYKASPHSRTGVNATGCPYCSNKAVFEGNCLATTHPEIAKEWHPHKNRKLTPYDVVAGTPKKIWWMCLQKHHEYLSSLNSRTKLKTGCPYCANKKACEDNCLATTHPELINEWHPIKNGKLTPHDILAGRNKKVWWICEKGHEYSAAPNNRAYSKTGCPICKQSKGERRIQKFLMNRMIPHIPQYLINDCKNINSLPFDFAVFNTHGDLITLIEFDGIQHEKVIEIFGGIEGLNGRKRNDRIKNEYCKKNKINLIRIKHQDFDRIEKILIEKFVDLGVFQFDELQTAY
ncbi:zinc-ribbon domain-containing protein (plasmid) [Brevibacillus halotolerans]|nr:zinc-ribbon domain-containing protein [Brevibacillus halotolerans]